MYTKTRYFALKRAEADLHGDTGRLRADIAETMALNGETELRIMDMRNQFQKDASDKLQGVRASLVEVTERLNAAADSLLRTGLVAPQAGTVIGLQVHTVGGVVRPGATLLDIVPKDDRMIVEAHVRPEEIDLVHKGLPAEVRFTAFNSRTTPVFAGRVSRVSADRFTDPSRGQAYYVAQVEIDPKQVANLTLQPGMPAEVYIVTGERTALDYLTRPIREQVQRGMLER
jgi:HlyD family type I secretion membrane fusion protein